MFINRAMNPVNYVRDPATFAWRRDELNVVLAFSGFYVRDDGKVVSWSIGTSPDAELENTMLDAAIETVTEGDEKPIVHSDRGGHYRWPGWLPRVAKAGLIRSMSRKACSPDNAACEGFFGRVKTEMFYPRDWRSTTIAQFIEALDAYIRWHNEKRIKSSLGYLSPIEYREHLGLTTETSPRNYPFPRLMFRRKSTL